MPLLDPTDLKRRLDGVRAATGAEPGESVIAATVLAVAISDAAADVASALLHLQEALRSDHPLQGQTFDGLTSAIESVAAAIEQHGTP